MHLVYGRLSDIVSPLGAFCLIYQLIINLRLVFYC